MRPTTIRILPLTGDRSLILFSDVNGQDNNGNTALHIAVQLNDCAVITALLALKANPKIKNSQDDTPIHLAARDGSLESLQVRNVTSARYYMIHIS